MRRLLPPALVTLVLIFLSSGSAFATTYYIAANGSDSNSGTSKSSPWLHAPGMSGCSGVCASTTPQPGDQFILRGGDTWHWGNSALSPFIGTCAQSGGTCWNWTAAGSSAGCNLNASSGPINTSTCIYIGVDKTWFSGSSWERPKFNGDNPITTSSPSSCAYEDSNSALLYLRASYVIVDNLEILGYCWNVTAPWGAVVNLHSNTEIRNSYFHGWTMGKTATGCGSCDSDEYWAIGPNAVGNLSNYVRIDHNVFDGSDATFGNGTTAGQATGGIFQTGGEIDHNVLVHVSNGMKYYEAILVHDNYFSHMYEPAVGGTHGNVMEWSPTNYTVSTYYFNNLTNNTNEGESIDMYPGSGGSSKHGYIFNNISWGQSNSPNCYMGEGDGSGGAGSFYFFNNTSDNPCSFSQERGSGSIVAQNNHFIGLSPTTLSHFTNMNTQTDNGNEVWQTESGANGQGYTSSNDYAPTSGNGATVGAGANLVSLCASMDNPVAVAACQKGYGGVTYDATNHVAVDNVPTSRPTTGAWDAGAYQYGGSTTVSAPTGLTAIVQ